MALDTIAEEQIIRLNTAIQQKYEYDFSNYAQNSYIRRIERIMRLYSIKTIDELIIKLRLEPTFFEEYLRQVTVNTTEMFRDPPFWASLREKVLPEISKHSTIRIWHAGCSSGEEVFTMAILLKEMGVYDQAKIFATDINDNVLEVARSGRYHIKNLDTHRANYTEAGCPGTLDDYFSIDGDYGVMDPALLDNVMLRQHDLVSGQVFSKFDLVLCRNVIIYFNRNLQDRVFRLFVESMYPEGFLGIGARESLIWSTDADKFATIDNENNIYQLK